MSAVEGSGHHIFPVGIFRPVGTGGRATGSCRTHGIQVEPCGAYDEWSAWRHHGANSTPRIMIADPESLA